MADGGTGFDLASFSLENYLEDVESGLLSAMARRSRNTYELADLLKINQSTVVRKLKKYKISLDKTGKTT